MPRAAPVTSATRRSGVTAPPGADSLLGLRPKADALGVAVKYRVHDLGGVAELVPLAKTRSYGRLG